MPSVIASHSEGIEFLQILSRYIGDAKCKSCNRPSTALSSHCFTLQGETTIQSRGCLVSKSGAFTLFYPSQISRQLLSSNKLVTKFQCQASFISAMIATRAYGKSCGICCWGICNHVWQIPSKLPSCRKKSQLAHVSIL